MNSGDSGTAEVVGTTGMRKMIVLRMSIPWTSSSFLLSVLLILVEARQWTSTCTLLESPDGTDYVSVGTSFEPAQQRFNVVVSCTFVQRRKAAIQERVQKFHHCLCLVSILQSLLLPCCFP